MTGGGVARPSGETNRAMALPAALEAADRVAVLPSPDGAAQRAGLEVQAHRPWPLAPGPWVMGQSWTSLLFAHWRVDAAVLRALVPPQLELDLLDGEAWLGVTPFEVRGLRMRMTPPVPLLSRFPELNVRTYVRRHERPGIWFFSLDAASPVAVAAARAAYHLPYYTARMRIGSDEDWTTYESARAGAEFAGRYRPAGAATPPQPGTLEHWLTERYCLYAVHDGRVLRADIHHPPWPLRPAEADIRRNTMTAPLGLGLSGPPLLHFADRQDVVIWAPAQA
jgi:uncharacterized protein YqjF (DUF2071 family)